MNYQVTHRTVYEYSEPVSVSYHTVRLEPKTNGFQRCEQFQLHIDPEPVSRINRTDYYGNKVCYFPIQESHQKLEIVSTSKVEVLPHPFYDLNAGLTWEETASRIRQTTTPDLFAAHEFIFASPSVPIIREAFDYARRCIPPHSSVLEAVSCLIRCIHQDFNYNPSATTIATPLTDVFYYRQGVCQDFAHLGIACLRSLGLAARYVSGYIRTIPPAGTKRLVGADASHAWFSVFCPDLGWVDFDPTNNCIPSSDHVVIAHGRDYTDVSPVSGFILGGGSHTIQVGVDVEERVPQLK